MAGADGVHIVLLHPAKIGDELFTADGEACNGVAVVPVDAFEFNLFVVKVNDRIPNLDLPDAYHLANAFPVSRKHHSISVSYTHLLVDLKLLFNCIIA